ncbi:MAG: hypothetical protein ACYS22_02920, partial [Planctomycetota bacterium]
MPASDSSQLDPMLNDVLDRLELYPHDPYLQYAALVLTRREGVGHEELERLSRIVEGRSRQARGGRVRGRSNEEVQLFGLFSGAHAVQENLQLNVFMPGSLDPGAKGLETASVAVSSLEGVTVTSHPWTELLEGRTPDTPALARMCPEDFYFMGFGSLTALTDTLDLFADYGGHLLRQTQRTARASDLGRRLKRQLVIETSGMLRPVYDKVVGEVAAVGSDLFLREGADLTLVFEVKEPALLKARFESFEDRARKRRPDLQETEGTHMGVRFRGLATEDREVSVYAAWLRPDLHLRSNSRVALERVIDAYFGVTPKGVKVSRLGDTDELRYMRTLMPAGEHGEDGFVYLSDAFIRKLVGPVQKITEVRRLRCYNHLRMIGHAALLHRVEHGRAAESIARLTEAGVAPGRFGEELLSCPGGGAYSLTEAGGGTCSVHGHARFLTPCIEIAAEQVTPREAAGYERFVREYNSYWSQFFDPVAVRLSVDEAQVRVETIVLPLIENSIYEGIERVVGRSPASLESVRVSDRAMFSFHMRLDRATIHESGELPRFAYGLLREVGRRDAEVESERAAGLVNRALGEVLGVHVYDQAQAFDLNAAALAAEAIGAASGRGGDDEFIAALIGTALNAPVSISVPVTDAQACDDLLEIIDGAVARLARRLPGREIGMEYKHGFSHVTLAHGLVASSYSFRFGPLTLRMFWARVGGAWHLASKPFILEDAQALHLGVEGARPALASAAMKGHASIRIRPEAWRSVLADYELSWAEIARDSCIDNLGPLTDALRGEQATAKGQKIDMALVRRSADELGSTRHFCPEAGAYELATAGDVRCSVHGTARAPRQPAAPLPGGPSHKALKELGGVSAS